MEKINTFPNVNYTKFCKTDLTLILKRHITVTTRKVYITISGKNFEQNILWLTFPGHPWVLEGLYNQKSL